MSPSLRSQSTTGLGREVIGLQKAKATAAASKAGQRTHHWSMRVGGMTMRVPPCGMLFSIEAAPWVGCLRGGEPQVRRMCQPSQAAACCPHGKCRPQMAILPR